MRNRTLSQKFKSYKGKAPRRGLRSTRRRKATSGTLGSLLSRREVLWGLVGSGMALGAFSALVATDRPPSNPSKSGRLRIVLLDSSDRNTAVQDRLISRAIEQEELADLREGDRLILFGLTSDRDEPLEERFNQVSPARAEERSGWGQDLYDLEETWKVEFAQPFVNESRRLRGVLEKSQTPLLEAMAQISSVLNAYEATEKRVLVVSDALHHIRDGLSGYTTDPKRAVVDMPDGLADFYQPDFGGAEIRLMHILRARYQRFQGAKHRAWIEKVTEGRNARLEYIAMS